MASGPANEVIPELTVAIPTINSARYLDIILGFYQANGIPVTVFVDDQTADDTFKVAASLGANTVWLPNARGLFAEALVEQISERCSTPWILRIDDDELPTIEMLAFVRQAIRGAESTVYGFRRYQCAVSRTGQVLRSRTVSPQEHTQWRLYQPKRMKYVPKIHSPGFIWEGEGTTAPASSSLIHLDWALHSYEERCHKIARYSNHGPNEGTRWRSFYLYEEQPGGDAFSELGLPEFEKIGLQIAGRFPKLCLEPEREQSVVS
jgi:glycosyltransferase involved in cell wall biosynthesis